MSKMRLFSFFACARRPLRPGPSGRRRCRRLRCAAGERPAWSGAVLLPILTFAGGAKAQHRGRGPLPMLSWDCRNHRLHELSSRREPIRASWDHTTCKSSRLRPYPFLPQVAISSEVFPVAEVRSGPDTIERRSQQGALATGPTARTRMRPICAVPPPANDCEPRLSPWAEVRRRQALFTASFSVSV